MSFSVRLFPSDQTGCGFSRLLEPARVLSGHADIVIEHCFQEDEPGGLEVTLQGRLGNEHVVAVKDPGCDVIVLQRPAHKHLIETIPLVQDHGVAVVVELDDDFESIDRHNSAYFAYDPARNPMQNHVWAKLGTQLADLVTVATPALAQRYGHHGRVVTLPNYIPERYLSTEPAATRSKSTSLPSIGWAGNPRTHPGDLQVMGKSVRNLVDSRRAVFHTIGHEDTLKIVSHGQCLPWAPIDEFPGLMATFDIGLAPLKDTAFNKSKSWLKALEYAALGVPFVGSPMPEYKRLREHGAGDLVRTTTPNTRAWEDVLTRLLEDEDYRTSRATAGRLAASRLTYEIHGERWLQAWADARTMRRAL